MKTIKNIMQLTELDTKEIFFSAFPEVHTIFQDCVISYIDFERENKYLMIIMPETGLSVKIWENYDISLDSDVTPINRVRIADIFEKLIKIGAISLEC